MRKNGFVSILIALLLATGCAPISENPANIETPANAGGQDADVLRAVPVSAASLLNPREDREDTAARTAARGANDFAFRLSAVLSADVGAENFVCSPYSVWLPLAALMNATAEPYRAALAAALGAPGLTAEDVNRAASRMLYDLTGQAARDYDGETDYHNPLQIANAVFVGSNVTLKRAFAQTFADFQRGDAFQVDFASDDAVRTVNAWASEPTDGLIDDIVQSFDED
ncbi:MAG: serpin family protein, partial [Oscillospiraceae bacterium]|nr:serpin family protein [Oscillospiraceae bacterium]